VDRRSIDSIVACLGRRRRLFYYFEDRYALMLLGRFVGQGRAVAEVRKSQFGRLLSRPGCRKVLADAGRGVLDEGMFASRWTTNPHCYRLTLGSWGPRKPSRHWQTTLGRMNLVLHLNFSSRHNRPYRRWFGRTAPTYVYAGHPKGPRGEHTLAWARLEVDLETGEVLVEELQSDWVRMYRWEMPHEDEAKAKVARYEAQILAHHKRVWQEALLCAVLEFTDRELGIDRVWYHTWESGARLKDAGDAPRSLYTKLPKRFCFQRTREVPMLLQRSTVSYVKRQLRKGGLEFWRLDLP